MNKLGVNFSKQFDMDCNTIFEMLSKIGFDAVFTGYSGEKKIEEFANAAIKNNLFYESIHAPFDGINSMWFDGDEGDVMLGRLVDCVTTCGKYEVPIAVVHLSSGENAPLINEIGYNRYSRLIEAAVKHNVVLAFENQRKLANLAFIFEAFDNIENVRFCWDMGHEFCFANGRRYMPLFGNKLVYTHIHDNFMEYNGDLHMIPFDGKIDFKSNMKLLKEYNYSGTLTLELIPQKSGLYVGYDVETFYRRAYNAVKKLRKML